MRTLILAGAALALAGCEQIKSPFEPSEYCKALIHDAVVAESAARHSVAGSNADIDVWSLLKDEAKERRMTVLRDCGDSAGESVDLKVCELQTGHPCDEMQASVEGMKAATAARKASEKALNKALGRTK